MPISEPCFCSFVADSLQFDLPSLWKGSVTVIFTGNHVKHVDITRDGILEERFRYCDNPAPLPHVVVLNPTPIPIPYRITPSHAIRLCGKNNVGDTLLDAATLNDCNDTGTKRSADWTFPIGGGDSVQIVIEILDESSGGGLLRTIASLLKRFKSLISRLVHRNS